MIYIIVGIYTIICTLLYKKYVANDGNIFKKSCYGKINVKSLKKAGLFLVTFGPCILLSGLRYGIANDYIKIYERGFYEIANDRIIVTEFEIGFNFLVKLCSKIVSKPWFMFLVVSIITIVFFVKGFERSKYFTLSVLLFFVQGIYFDSFNGIRQYIVVAIFIYAYRFIEENSFKKYLLTMLVASLFHISALITIPLYFIKKEKVNYVLFGVVMCGMFVFKNKLLELFLKLMTLLPKSNSYIEKGTYINYISTNLSGLLISAGVLVLYLYVYRKIGYQQVGIFQLNMAYLGLVFAICSIFLPLMDRFLYFTKAYYLISVPYALSLIDNKKERVTITIFFVTSILALNVYGIVWNDWYGIIPYVSIFSH